MGQSTTGDPSFEKSSEQIIRTPFKTKLAEAVCAAFQHTNSETREQFSDYLLNLKTVFMKLQRVRFKEPYRKTIRTLYALLLLFFLSGTTFGQQTMTVSGRVTGANDESLGGVSVQVKGGNTGTATDENGNYTIQVPSNVTLVFSFVGYESKEISVGNQPTINVHLEQDLASLGEVMIIGYGTQKKSDLTGAISSISTAEYKEQPVIRVDQVLQGRATGVQVTNASGAPGADARIRIRGANSVLGDNNPLYVVDGFIGVDFNTINPEDIETIQILKDAASTAIYGSRGANGVIIITTKKGKQKGVSVTYSPRVSQSKIVKRWDVLNAGDYAEIVNKRSDDMGLARIFSEQEVSEFKQKGGTDWQDLVFRTAWGQQHQLSVAGKGDRTSFLISGNYLNNDGIINNSGFKRYMFRSNITTKLVDKLSLRFNASASRTENKNTNLLSGTSNPVVQALAWAPTTPAYTPDGKFTPLDPTGSVMSNPVALIYDHDNIDLGNFVNLVGGLNYQLPVEGLNLDLLYGADYISRLNQSFNGVVASRGNPGASRSSAENWRLQGTAMLTYGREFNGMHRVDAVAVFETQKQIGNSFSASSGGLQFPALGFYNLPLASSYQVGSGFSKETILSYLGRINYAFRDKYLLSIAVRRDGSSKFRAGNKYSTFPTLGIGYNIGKEDFIRDLNVFHSLKIRASWGKTGSQAVRPYATLSTYNTNAPVAFNNSGVTSGIQLGNPGNPNLKWETTDQFDIGIESSFLNGRLSFEFDYFKKNTHDLLLNQALPEYVGGGTLTQNVGEVENKGFELSVRGIIVDSKDWNWTSNFNISRVKNRILSLGGIADRIGQGTGVGAGMSITNEFMLIPGQSLGSYWGIIYLGTWKKGEEGEAAIYNAKPGDSRYQDTNGDKQVNTDDYQIMGRGIPTVTGGWNNTISYKSFTLNAFFQAVFGIDKLNYTRAAAMSGSGDARQYILSEIKDRYIPGVNETSDIPAFSSTNVVFTQSSRFIESGDYIRLKNLSLSYKIPLQKKWDMSVFVSATNLLTITKYKGIDPESSNIGSWTDTAQGIDYGAYPNSRTYTGGISLTF